MNVRRLAGKQPPSFAFTPANLEWAKAQIAKYPPGRQQSAVIPILWRAQQQAGGWLPQKAMEAVAELLGMANIRVLDKVSWMNTTLQDGPWDMYVEDLLSLITLDSNGYLSNSTSSWSHPRHNDPKVDEYYARYARELDPAKRKVIAKELVEFMADKMYWNNVSGSPFFMVAQPSMKGYVYNAEFQVHFHKVWLDK